jgi:DNA helicase-2/ATP-dependent DNA helicase PcrA
MPTEPLFGDHWQTIYRGDFQIADFPNVVAIDKGSNFRSAPAIVTMLNELRPELKQEVSDPDALGSIQFFHANGYSGVRTNTAHSKEDLPDGIAQQYTNALKERLKADGWSFSADTTKVLMLTHNAIAAEQGYPNIAAIFDRNEAFAKKEDSLIEFFADTLEPVCRAYSNKKYGEMFRILRSGPNLSEHQDKVKWRNDMDALMDLRLTGTIGAVIDHLKATGRPRLSEKLMRREEELAKADAAPEAEESKGTTRYRKLRDVSYQEVIALFAYLEGATTFATQHSVKGAQFNDVLVILGGGWNHYKWPQLLELLETKAVTPQNTGGYHRARNLFYVAVSRPRKRLAVLATQTLSATAMASVQRLFGKDHVHELTITS